LGRDRKDRRGEPHPPAEEPRASDSSPAQRRGAYGADPRGERPTYRAARYDQGGRYVGPPRGYHDEQSREALGRRLDQRRRGDAGGATPGGSGPARARRGGREGADDRRDPPDGRDRMATPIGQLPSSRRPEPAHLTPRHDRRRLGAVLLAGVVLLAAAFGVRQFVLDTEETSEVDDLDEPVVVEDDAEAVEDAAPDEPVVEAPSSGFATPGLLTFRGSPTRSYHGEGPLPSDPGVLWTYPGDGSGMCAESTVGQETRTWCGSGWTGQPSVFERDGRTWVVFGAYDRKVHFVDYDTGEDIIPPYETGDIIKGSVTVDPDGLPLVYSGSRDNEMHVIAIDRPEPVKLWSLHANAVSPTKWNDDWDASPLVMDDYMYQGGENSQFHIVKLNRSTGEDGLVQVAPELVFNAPGWDDELTAALATRQNDVSIENSVAYLDGVVYFANSGGLVQGWDVSGLAEGVEPTRVFRYWAGDDIDASIVIDDEGFLYVGIENERFNERAAEVGQFIKLDPRDPDDPLVWSLHDSKGFWATPALYEDIVIAPSDSGTVYALDRQTGDVRWTFDLPPPTWQSPVVIDDTLVQGDCEGGLHAYDLSDTSAAPPELWTVELEGCIESTPAVWQGRIFVGTRGGLFYAIGDS
jgi:outer membrane protein assembly factor BamB